MKRKHSDWIVIHMVHGLSRAEAIERRLTEEGFWVRLRAVGTGNPEEQFFEILALPSEAREAQQLILRAGL